MKPEPLFYIQREGTEAGPYDLVQMAGLLRRRIIDDQTPTRQQSEDNWKPFSWQPQFLVAREMSPDAVSTRIEEQIEKNAPPIPLPSAETVIKIIGVVVLQFVLAIVVYFLARADVTMGICLAVAGVALALLGTCMIYVRMVDESGLTLFKIFVVPFYDLYYFIIHFWDYWPYFCMKYMGGVMALAALVGIASNSANSAQGLQSLFHFYGQ